MLLKVYVETSVIGAYFEERSDMELQTFSESQQVPAYPDCKHSVRFAYSRDYYTKPISWRSQ